MVKIFLKYNLSHVGTWEIIKSSIKYKIKYLTLYAFSTENWKRPKKEIKFLFSLLENFLLNKLNDLNKQNIKLKIIGNIDNFSPILIATKITNTAVNKANIFVGKTLRFKKLPICPPIITANKSTQ